MKVEKKPREDYDIVITLTPAQALEIIDALRHTTHPTTLTLDCWQLMKERMK